MTAPAGPTGNAVVDAILSSTTDGRLQEAMLLGSNLESGWSTTAVGDHNSSFGPFQIHLPAHPGVSQAQAEDPAFAVKFMTPAYQSAVNAQGNLFSTNPELAAERAAFAAERPAVDYLQKPGQKTVDAKWTETLAAVGKGAINNIQQSDPVSGSNGILSQIGNSLASGVDAMAEIGKFFDLLTTFFTTKLFLPSTWARVLAFNVGAILILIGLWLFFSKPGAAANVASNIAGVAGNAAGAIK